MAKKKDETKVTDEKPADVKTEKTTADGQTDVPEEPVDKNGETEPKSTEKPADKSTETTKVTSFFAFIVRLCEQHPQHSYGRCGYRFNKTEETVIERNALTGEQIIALFTDPWLVVTPIVDE
ncbi:hypothetical protein [Caviibacterium pharyngocola]|uniref:Mu-like prophage FluMu N-terminal domain-containing protein n=1 Tax=Caviibacterium pharyngocola TaxID=28159 RepID=A0A2M8RY11_9PAST|nr:hypothetical protein [Caviibacterium pharyngocola]PJG83772.1 hypothetical protein CVP04_01380 [Caviibacterium pharyngocola]